MQLESGTTEKFSQHLIYHIPDEMFKCNQHCGEFVRTICGDAMVAVEHGVKTNFTKSSPIENLRLLFVKRGGKECITADLLVYHRNMHFRLLHSSKGEKMALMISDESCFPITQKDVFLDTLICTNGMVSRSCRKLQFVELMGRSPRALVHYMKPFDQTPRSSFPAVDRLVSRYVRSHPNHL